MRASVQVAATNEHPADAVTVELRGLVAAYPSAVLSITRHGVEERYFSREELVRVAQAIINLDRKLDVLAARPEEAKAA